MCRMELAMKTMTADSRIGSHSAVRGTISSLLVGCECRDLSREATLGWGWGQALREGGAGGMPARQDFTAETQRAPRPERAKEKGAAVIAPRRPLELPPRGGFEPAPTKRKSFLSTCRPCRHRQAYRHRRLRQRPSCRLPGCRPRELPW